MLCGYPLRPGHGFGPPHSLLHFVKHNDRAFGSSRKAGSLPLLSNPFRTAKRRLIGDSEDDWSPSRIRHLLHKGGLSNLARARNHLDETAGFIQTACKYSCLWSLVVLLFFAHYAEHIYSNY